MLANRPIHSVEPRTGFVQAHVTRASDPQLAMSRGLWAPNRRFEGAQRAPNWLVQGARGPPIEKVSANTVVESRLVCWTSIQRYKAVPGSLMSLLAAAATILGSVPGYLT
jgi:hypothetical protein